MSTKTNFKRIALVAVAALGLGVLSSVPSSAFIAPSTMTLTATAGTATIGKSDSSTAATISLAYMVTVAADTVSVTAALKSKATAAAGTPALQLMVTETTSVSTGVVNVRYDSSTATGPLGSEISTNITTPTGTTDSGVAVRFASASPNTYAGGTIKAFLETGTTRVAGTYVYTVNVTPYLNGVANTTNAKSVDVSIVIAALGSATASPATSVATLTGGSSFSGLAGVDSAVSAASTAATTAIGNIRVTLADSDGSSIVAAESVTVTTNVGSLGITSGTTGALGRSLTLAYTANTSLNIFIYPDGSAGTATITITTPSVTFASKSVSFYSTTSTKIAASQIAATLTVGSNSNAVLGKSTDANGQTVIANSTGAAGVWAYSSNTAVVSDSGTACTYSATLGQHTCSLTGVTAGTATITLRNSATAGTASTVSSTEVISVTVVSNTPATLKMEFDKATYAPGEKGFLKIWAVDSTGKAVGPQTLTNLVSSSGISRSGSFSGTEPTWTATSYAVAAQSPLLGNSLSSTTPIAVLTVYMPYSGGAISVSATGGSLLPASGQVKVTATASVTDSASAALAAVTALATTVASLKTLITTLTNLVLKIQKKVKA